MAYLDECGFSPSQPVNYSWSLAKERKILPFENTEGRRVNVLATVVVDGPNRSLTWMTAARTLKAADLVRFLEEVVTFTTPNLVIVLDNASVHRSRAVTAIQPALAKRGITLFFLPPYSPRLNRIEPFFGAIKHHDLPERRYDSVARLTDHVDAAFERAEARLLARINTTSAQPGPSA